MREPHRADERPVTRADVADSFGQLKRSIAHAREVPGLWRFLFGRFFYSDAVNTVIVVMSVVVVKTMGLSEATANVVLLLLTFVAIVMSFVWGWLVDRQGPKKTLIWVLISWAVGLVLGGVAIGFGQAGLVPFLVAGAILGSGLGGVQVADRVLMVRLSPPERIGEFFGIYGLVGKGSQVIGQLVYGALIFLLLDRLGTGAYQVAVLSLLVTMLIGLWLVWPVSDRWSGSGELAEPSVPAMPAPRRPVSRPTARRSTTAARPSVAVPVRVGRPPGPGGPDHRVEGRAARRPAEHLPGPGVGRHEHRRIARAARPDRVRDRPPDRGLDRRQDLADGEAVRRAEVARDRRVARRARAGSRGRQQQRRQVRVGEVRDVDVVADRRPVRGRVVVAEDRQRRATRHGDQGVRDQVRLGPVHLADPSVAPATLK